MKICFVCCEYPPGPHGGIGTMTQVLGRALARKGHEVRVIGVYPPWYNAAKTEVDNDVHVSRLWERTHPLGWVFSRYELYQTVQQLTQKGMADVVEVPDYAGWAAGWRRLNAPVVTRLHGSLTYFAAELHKPVENTAYWLERASLRRADYSCSVCKYTADMTERVFKLPMTSAAILYNPVETPGVVTDAARSRNRVVFSGTLTPKKGIVSLIKAWPIVANSIPNAELHVYGKDGRAENGEPMQAYLRSLLPASASGGVYFHGHVSREELFSSYRTATAAVFPSYAEAFAVAPLEAMACGCPTIFSQRGSGPELLTHEREGLLVDPDKPENIAASILRVLQNTSFAREIGEAGRARIHQAFSIERMVAENVAFYERCAEDFRRKHSLN